MRVQNYYSAGSWLIPSTMRFLIVHFCGALETPNSKRAETAKLARASISALSALPPARLRRVMGMREIPPLRASLTSTGFYNRDRTTTGMYRKAIYAAISNMVHVHSENQDIYPIQIKRPTPSAPTPGTSARRTHSPSRREVASASTPAAAPYAAPPPGPARRARAAHPDRSRT